MGLNGVSGVQQNAYTTPAAASTNTAAETEQANNNTSTSTPAATYEKGSNKPDKNNGTVKPDKTTVDRLKADTEARNAQLQSLVSKMMGQQANKYGSIYDFLRNGTYTVDAKTKAQAQKDIAEDGYWGVKQTSDRLVDFAKAISGNDVSKADKLITAMKKGFSDAEKSWGGKLPGICQQTISETLKKMDEWKNEISSSTEE